MAATSCPTHVFVLIHGTFARGAAWTGEDSKLTKGLRESYPSCKILRFLWSGANSHSARLSAAAELRSLLKATAEECPTARIHLVAHSHGGNVALYALDDASIVELITTLVCISTPFIRCTGRDTSKLHFRLQNVVVGLLITTAELLCYYVGKKMGAVGFVMLAGNIAVFAAVNIGVRRLGPKISKRFSEKQKAIVDRLDLGDDTRFLLAGKPFILVARVARDEAALLLRSSFLMSRIPHFLNLVGTLALTLVVVTVGLSLFSFGPLAHKSVEAIYMAWFMAAIAALGTYVLIATVTFVVRSHPLAFGWEGLFDGFFVDLDIGPTPNFEVIEEKFKVRRGFRLRHSALYEDDIFVGLLPHWVRISEEMMASRVITK